MGRPTVTLLRPKGNCAGRTAGYPLIEALFSDDDGDRLAKFQIQVKAADAGTLMWLSDEITATNVERRKSRISIGYGDTARSTAVASALTYGTTYKIRVRAWGNSDSEKPSKWTAWTDFIPRDQPEIPLSFTPRDKQIVTASLSGGTAPEVVVSGTFAHPEGRTQAAYQYIARLKETGVIFYDTGSITDAVANFSDQLFSSAHPNGDPSSPGDISWDTEYLVKARIQDNNNTWGEWSDENSFKTASPPKPPKITSPENGQVLLSLTPKIAWEYEEGRFGSGPQTAAEVRVLKPDNTHVTGSPFSVTTDEFLQLTSAAGLAFGTRYRTQVRTKGYADPGFGQWSGFTTFLPYVAIGVEITSPTFSATVTDPTPTVKILYTGSVKLVRYQVLLYTDQEETELVYDSEYVEKEANSGNTVRHVVDGQLDSGETYYLRVNVWDESGQHGQSGLIPFSTSWSEPAAIAGFTATPVS